MRARSAFSVWLIVTALAAAAVGCVPAADQEAASAATIAAAKVTEAAAEATSAAAQLTRAAAQEDAEETPTPTPAAATPTLEPADTPVPSPTPEATLAPTAEPALPECRWTAHVSEEPPAERSCASGYALRGIRCEGRYCDNMELYCCPYVSGEDPAGARQWSDKWFSEETPGEGANADQTNAGFVTGIRCSGRYCDSLSLEFLTSPSLPNAGQCSFQPFFSEEGAMSGENEDFCPEGHFVAGLACREDYCDEVSLYCCRAGP